MRAIRLAFLIAIGVSVQGAVAHGQQVIQQGGNVAAATAPPVEYSNLLDEEAILGGGQHDGLDPLQVLYTEPPDVVGPPFPGDSIDFGEEGAVDALANMGDALFWSLVNNQADLLVSFFGDPTAAAPDNNGVFAETTTGARFSPLWTHTDFSNQAPNPESVEDVDALELWGPIPGWDANMYSVQGDGANTVSVYYYPPGGPPAAYVPHADIVAAVQFLGYTGPEGSVDLDALMVFDIGGGFDHTWNADDEIIFSIRAAANWDGGELVHLTNLGGGAFARAYLSHGGHLWDTPFAVGTTFGVNTEEVDAIEAAHVEVAVSFGACCLTPETCLETTGVECAGLDGKYHGDGSTCTGLTCIPAVSEWGLAVMLLLGLTAGTVVIMRRRRGDAAA